MSTRGREKRRAQTRGRVESFHLAMAIARKDVRLWSQEELAHRASRIAKQETGDPDASVSPATVAMIESGRRNPSLEVAGWLAKALGYRIEDLGVLRPDPETAVAS